MRSEATIWLEPGDDLYDAPLSDPRLIEYAAAAGVFAPLREWTDSDKWRWIEAVMSRPLAPRDDD